MKGFFVLLCVIVFGFLTISCISGESAITSTKTDPSFNTQSSKIHAKINQTVLQKWTDEEGLKLAKVSVEIENTGINKFKIDKIKYDVISTNGTVLDSDYNYSEIILNQKEKTYDFGNFTLDNISSIEEIDKIEVTVYYSHTLKTKKELPIQEVKIESIASNSEIEVETQQQTIANVVIFNNTNNTIKNYNVRLALFGKNNNLLLVSGCYHILDDSFSIPPQDALTIPVTEPAIRSLGILDNIENTWSICWY